MNLPIAVCNDFQIIDTWDELGKGKLFETADLVSAFLISLPFNRELIDSRRAEPDK